MDRILRAAALVLLLAAFFGYCSTPLWDSDFWWHAATGRHIVLTASLPGSDPFAVYEATSVRSEALLKSYWAAQVLFYLVIRDFGVGGIIFLKASVLTACLVILFRRSSLADSPPLLSFLATALAGLTALNYTGERPQLFSFLFASLVFLLLDIDRRSGRRRWLYAVPLVMLVWANAHGGVVLGSVLLVAYAGGRTIEARWEQGPGQDSKGLLVLWTVIGLSVLVTFLTPSGLNSYLTVLHMEGSEMQKRSSEYLSPLAVWRQTGVTSGTYFVLLCLAPVALFPLVREREISKALTLILLAGISATAYRYVPFFVFLAGPAVALGIGRLLPRFSLPKRVLWAVVIVLSISALTIGFQYDTVFQRRMDHERFPIGAVNRLQEAGIRGRMFSSLEWGGYLIWNAHPDIQVFIDGRVLDLRRLTEYTHILWATPAGSDLFRKERFDLVLLPWANRFTGEHYALNQVLLADPQWRVLYRDARSVLFGRRPAVMPGAS